MQYSRSQNKLFHSHQHTHTHARSQPERRQTHSLTHKKTEAENFLKLQNVGRDRMKFTTDWIALETFGAHCTDNVICTTITVLWLEPYKLSPPIQIYAQRNPHSYKTDASDFKYP